MARTNPPSSGSRAVRGKPVQVQKPFPWGFAAGVSVVVLLLGGILLYAALNSGSGLVTSLERADREFTSLRTVSNPDASHVQAPVDYGPQPPNSGNHSQFPQQCAVYTEPIASEHAVHSLEHGAVWVTYQPDLPQDQVDVLAGLVQGDPYRMLSPFPGLDSPVSLQAWGRSVSAESATDPVVQEFLDAYTTGPQTQEPGAQCGGGPDFPANEVQTLGPDGTFVPLSSLAAAELPDVTQETAPPPTDAPATDAPPASDAPEPSPTG